MQSSIGAYTILPINLPALPCFPTKETLTHTLYIRPHAPKIPTEYDARSLFIANVPIDATPEHFRAICKDLVGAGRFESISFEGQTREKPTEPAVGKGVGGKRKRGEEDGAEDTEEAEIEELAALPKVWDRELRKSGGSAVLRMVDGKSVEGILKAVRKLHKASAKLDGKAERQVKWPVWGAGLESTSKIPPLGSARYATHHALRYPDAATLQHAIDTYMRAFNAREASALERDKRGRAEPDADGFITVSKHSRQGTVRREVAEERLREREEKERGKREELERAGFYRWQGREARKREMEGLKKGFEEDRKRVEGMKEGRGRGVFRPER